MGVAGAVSEAPVLNRRALNRALLDRQYLLARAELSASRALDRLLALQAQSPKAPYFALWARLKAFQPEDLSAGLEDLSLARGTLMRGTLHVAAARDFAAIRPLIQRGLDGVLTEGSVYGRALAGLDREAIAQAAYDLLREQPRTTAELRAALASLWPGRDPQALTMVARIMLPMLQLPPRGLWGRGGQPMLAAMADRLDSPEGEGLTLDDLVRRYLAAFGPASVADAQTWLGLSRLAPVFDVLRPALLTFRDAGGVELFDLPEASRPSGDVAAPVRLLGEFDNMLLAHEDRGRIMRPEHKRWMFTENGILRAAVLIDGFVAGRWRIEDGKAESVLRVELFDKPAKAAAKALGVEGEALLAFAARHDRRDIRIETLDGT
jgi:hypothetical protein